MAVPTYTKTGNKSSSSVTLDKDVFAAEIKSHELLKQAYVAQQANSRANNASTKLRGEVRGGGRKPWQQKGTGRARAGSIRSPLWRGGGITFGPSGQENYSKKLNKKAKLKALRQALSIKTDVIKVIDTFETKGKASSTVELLDKMELNGRTLLVVSVFDELVDRATRNVAGLKAVQAEYLNVVDVLDADNIVLSKKAVAAISERLGEK